MRGSAASSGSGSGSPTFSQFHAERDVGEAAEVTSADGDALRLLANERGSEFPYQASSIIHLPSSSFGAERQVPQIPYPKVLSSQDRCLTTSR